MREDLHIYIVYGIHAITYKNSTKQASDLSTNYTIVYKPGHITFPISFGYVQLVVLTDSNTQLELNPVVLVHPLKFCTNTLSERPLTSPINAKPVPNGIMFM